MNVVATALDLLDAEPGVVLGWYDEIVAAVDRVSAGGEIGPARRDAVAALGRHVGGTIERGGGVLAQATATLAPAEVVSNAAVMMFGGIETSEGMTTTLFWHLLTHPEQLAAVRGRSIAGRERRRRVAAARARRRAASTATRPTTRSWPAPSIRAGRPRHRVADGGQSRPGDIPGSRTASTSRGRTRGHTSRSPRVRTPAWGATWPGSRRQAALDAALDAWPGLELDPGATPPTGVIFRKPRSLPVRWVS